MMQVKSKLVTKLQNKTRGSYIQYVDIHVHLVLDILVDMCFGTDENGTRQIFEIFDEIANKLKN